MAQLITSIAQVQEYIRVGNALDIKTLLPSLNEVEMQELTFYLGADLLAEIITQKSANIFTPRIEKIFPYVMAAHACLAVYKAGPEIEVLVSDSGIMRTETSTEKSAWGGQVKRFRDVAADRGFKALDSFLLILEKYEQDYPEWLASQYYGIKDGLLIRSAVEFEAAGEGIQGSSLTFQAFRPIMMDIQEQTLRDSLPAAMYQEILDQLKSDSLTPGNKTILNNYLRPALAKLTIEEALTQLPVEVSNSGVSVNQLELAGDSRTSKRADISLIEKKAWGLRGRGGYYLSNMKEYLNTTATALVYPLWFSSTYYAKSLRARIEEESLPAHERKIFRG
jgi:hypothetical protein